MITISRACAAAVFACAATATLGAPRALRVSFRNGATEATLKGDLRGFAVAEYVFPAKTGETVAINLKSTQPSLCFTLTAPQNHELTFQANEFKGVAPLDGDYKVNVMLLRKEAQQNASAAYTLTISHAMVEPPAEPE